MTGAKVLLPIALALNPPLASEPVFSLDDMSTNRFTPEKYYDFCIVDDDGLVVGHVRVKPSGIHWAPKNSKKWYGVPLEKFAEWIELEGERKTK